MEKLIDSLRKESNAYKKEADSLRQAYRNLQFAQNEKEFQLEANAKNMDLKTKLFNAELKALKRKRLGLGVSTGYGLDGDGQSVFAGISLHYTLFRF